MSILPKHISTGDFIACLLDEGVLDHTSAGRVRSAAEVSGTSIERTVLELGLASEDSVYRVLAKHLGLRFVEAREIEPDLSKRLGLDPEFLERVMAIPVTMNDGTLLVATAEIESQAALDSIGFYLSTPVTVAITAPSTIQSMLAFETSDADEGLGPADGDVARLKALANDGPVVKYVNDIVAKAAGARASDIHFEAQDVGARVRFRVDGTLGVEGQVSTGRLAAVVSRVKVMAGLNISEKRRPQDGRMTVAVRGRNIDIRLSTLPTQHGESIVMRLLDQERVDLDWASLGFQGARVAELRNIINQPNGIFLVAGPTGSGKTTTLYTALREINHDDRKIVTVEDPIEYSLSGINQTQVEPGIDMTFARALRAILRQDPDVVMVGEIRDEETAEIAVRAALIGRLVLSTIHTNDSLAAVARLRDLGVPSYLLGNTLRGVLSQRLVRRTCSDCAGQGGSCCNGTGTQGRQVISELLTVTPQIAESIAKDDSQRDLQRQVLSMGFATLHDDANNLCGNGVIDRASVEDALGLDMR